MCATDPSQPSQNKEQPETQVQAKEVSSPTDPSQPSQNKQQPTVQGKAKAQEKAKAQGRAKEMNTPTSPSQASQKKKQPKTKNKNSPPDSSQPSQDKQQPKAQQNTTEVNSQMQSLILGTAMFTMLLPALSGVIFVMFCPLIGFFLQLDMKNAAWWMWTAMALLQGLHLRLLWTSVLYLSIFRKLLYPYRKLLMLLIPLITKIQCIQNKSQPWYVDLTKIPRGNDDQSEIDTLRASFRGKVRKTYKKMEASFRQDRIRCESLSSEDSMRLCDIAPFMWQHKQELCAAEGKTMALVFLKRFLAVIIPTDAILDLYYDENNTLCGLTLTMVQGNVFNAFMYFSTKPRSGIWYHGVMASMVRAMKMDSVRYINEGHGAEQTKKGAGFTAMEVGDPNLANIYPVTVTRGIPKEVISTAIWQETTSGNDNK